MCRGIQVRHTQVQEDHIRLHLFKPLHQFAAIGRFAHDVNIVFQLEELPQTFSNDGVIVCDYNADLVLSFLLAILP